jgi:hypothetical protein
MRNSGFKHSGDKEISYAVYLRIPAGEMAASTLCLPIQFVSNRTYGNYSSRDPTYAAGEYLLPQC